MNDINQQEKVAFNIVGIYHGGCIDGTTSAAILLKRFKDIQVFPLSHGYSQEDIDLISTNISPDINNTFIYTLDCALGAQHFLDLGYKVITLDHHITDKEVYEEVAQKNSRFTYIFDITKSGSSLAWSYFFPNSEIPRVVSLVEDGDLWIWKYGDESKNLLSYLSMLRNKPEEILPLLDGIPHDATLAGNTIGHYIGTIIDQYTNKAKSLVLNIGNYKALVYNITDFQSDCGHILSEKTGSAVGLFGIKGDEVRFSFRSTDTNMPSALDLATILGGGGHRNSAGAKMKLKEFILSLEL
jgi:oligoribonuclease NrnB/cAMP/cGMP phosphodiesterase (DHH superfamily)